MMMIWAQDWRLGWRCPHCGAILIHFVRADHGYVTPGDPPDPGHGIECARCDYEDEL